ncbi:MAG: hypothetical protein ACM3RP_11495 [Chitinophagales bacterium]
MDKWNHRDLFDWRRKVGARVVVDGNAITANGEAFVEFTFTLMEALQAYGAPFRRDQPCGVSD